MVEDATYLPLEGPSRREGWAGVAVDDILLVCAPPETITPVHPSGIDITVEVGPYLVRGLLPSLPGFDPARALARPTGSFVLVGQVTVELRGLGSAAGQNPHAFL